MMTRATRDGTQAGFFVIADISGYTAFVAQNDLAHAQGVLAEITGLLIEKLSAPFRFVELEGDAVFVFAPDVAVEDSERLVDIMEVCYAAFRTRLEQMSINSSCECTACKAIPDLDLKFVAHHGSYLPQQTPTGTKFVGAPVIAVHRLLKNEVVARTGIRAYALLTDAFVGRARFGDRGLGLPEYVEEIPHLGRIGSRVIDLSSSIERYRETTRCYISSEEADMEIVTEVPAARSVVWSYCVDAKRRHRWQLDTMSVENQPSECGRSGVGLVSHCDHGGYRLNLRIADWQPFDYLTMETFSMGRSIKRPPSCFATFALEELPGTRCKLSFRIRLHNRSLLMQALFAVIRPMVRREWAGHFATLTRVVREETSQIEE